MPKSAIAEVGEVALSMSLLTILHVNVVSDSVTSYTSHQGKHLEFRESSSSNPHKTNQEWPVETRVLN